MTTPQPKKESNAVKLERHNSDVDDLQPVNDLLVEQKTVDISRETGEINQKNKIQYQNVTHAESLKNALTNTMTAAYPKPKQKAIPGKRAAASFESKHPKKKMKVEQDSELKQTIHPNYNEHITKILEGKVLLFRVKKLFACQRRPLVCRTWRDRKKQGTAL
jgi:hypothetical protein